LGDKEGEIKMKDDGSSNKGHRPRLREKFMLHRIMDYEVFELLLVHARPRIDVKPIAKRLLSKYGGVHGVLSAPLDQLTGVEGVGKNTAILIKVVYELMLLNYKNYLRHTPVLKDLPALKRYCKMLLSGKQIEEFHVLYLGEKYNLITTDLHSSGTFDRAEVPSHDIGERAFALKAKHLILMHNHPSDKKFFSEEDIATTIRLKNVLAELDIDVMDHLLVVGNRVISAKQQMLMK
jgi:DNA repair protein RadC